MFGNKDDQVNDNSQMMAPSMPSSDATNYGAATNSTVPSAPPVDPYTAAPAPPTTPTSAPQQDTPPSSLQPAYGGFDTSGTDTSQSTNTPDPQAQHSSTPTDVNHQDLLDIKQEALHHLGPMVGSLEQTPEEKFKTLMMMIQASDDHTKLKDAFEMAKQITDDKARAQGLLDIINEINYFTQSSSSQN